MSADLPATEPIPNPVHDTFNISVLVPEQITIRMVDASALSDYEVWVFLASVMASASTGFLVPYLQAEAANDPMQRPLFWMTVVMLTLFLVSLSMALGKRA